MNNYRWAYEMGLILFVTGLLAFWWRATVGHGLARGIWAYFLGHAAITSMWPHWEPNGIHPDLAQLIQRNAAQIGWMLSLYLPVIFMFTRRARTLFFRALALLLVADLIWMEYSGFGFLFTWPTFETAMAAIILPFLYADEKMVFKMVAVVLWAHILFVLGTTGIVVGASGIFAYLLVKRFWWLATAPLCIIPFAIHFHKFPQASGRLAAWKVYMDWWEHFANPYVGYGTGAAEWVIPFLKWDAGDGNAQSMNLMHNDWLQILFDTGLIGWALATTLAVWVLKRLWKKPEYFAAGVSYVVCMEAYFPLHYAIGQIILCILISEAL